MENLCEQTRLVLSPEYQESLTDLCTIFLRYFAEAFVFLGGIRDKQEEAPQSLIQTSVFLRDELFEEIKRRDRACQSFRLKISVVEDSRTAVDCDEVDSDVSQ